MGKIAEFNRNTQAEFNEMMAEQLLKGESILQRKITGAEFLHLSPYSLKSGKIYEGVNFITLLPVALAKLTGAFLTFNQIRELGGKVLEGSKAHKIIFWSFSEAKDENGDAILNKKGDPYSYAFLKRYNVFNLADTSLKDTPQEAPQREQIVQMRESICEFVKANLKRLENPQGDGLDFNRFLACIGYHDSQRAETDMATSYDIPKHALVGELVNLFISAKIGGDFNPILAPKFSSKWANLLNSGYIDFLKAAKVAKKIGEEMLTWEALSKVESESLKNIELLTA